MTAVSQKVSAMPTLPSALEATDLIYVVRQSTSPYDFKALAAGELFAVITGTRAEILALKTGADLIPTMNYYISDRDIMLVAATVDTFFDEGTWYRDTTLKAFGSIIYSYTSGAATISNVIVNGVTITSGGVAFNTDLPTTMIALAANINAFQSSYTAYAIGRALVIESDTVGAAANGYVITSAVSSALATSITNMANGVATSTQQLSVVYDIVNDEKYRCVDAENNIQYYMSQPVIDVLGYNPIDNFRWGDLSYFESAVSDYISAFISCQFYDTDISNFFVINTRFYLSTVDETRFTNCLFINSDCSRCSFSSISKFNNSVFYDFDINGSYIDASRFDTYAYFSGFDMPNSRITLCDFRGISATTFSAIGADLAYCDFSAAIFTTVTFDYCMFKYYVAMASQTVTRVNASGSIIANGSYELCLTSPTMTGASTLGLSGSAIPLFVVPANFTGYGFTMVWGASLSTTSSPELIIGLATDGTDCYLTATTTTLLNSGQQNGVAIVASTALRQIIATPSVANITAGTFRIRISGMIKP